MGLRYALAERFFIGANQFGSVVYGECPAAALMVASNLCQCLTANAICPTAQLRLITSSIISNIIYYIDSHYLIIIIITYAGP